MDKEETSKGKKKPVDMIQNPTLNCPFCGSNEGVEFLAEDGSVAITGCWSCGWTDRSELAKNT